MRISHIKVTHSDLKALRELSIATFRASFGDRNTPEDLMSYEHSSLSMEQLQKQLDNSLSHFYFSKVDEQIVGYLKLNEAGAQTEDNIHQSIELERIYLLEESQGKGIGQQMLDYAIAFTKAQGCKTLWLGVWNENIGAIRFYERNGFKTFGSHDFLLGSDLQTDLLMKLELTPLTKD